MQITALVVEFLIPGMLILTGLFGIIDGFMYGKLLELVFSQRQVAVGTQVGIGVLLLAVAYLLGLFSSLRLFRVEWLRRRYRRKAAEVLDKYAARLKTRAGALLGFPVEDLEVLEVEPGAAAERLFDEIWGYLRARRRLEPYAFMVSVERLCRGYIIASPLLVSMIIVQAGMLVRRGLLEFGAVGMWFAGVSVLVLIALTFLAVRLLIFAVEEEYYILALVFLGISGEVQRGPTVHRRERGDSEEGTFRLILRVLTGR